MLLQGGYLPYSMAPFDPEDRRECPETPPPRVASAKCANDTSQSIYWTPCGSSPLGLNFSLPNWSCECCDFSLCNDLSIQHTRADARTRLSNGSSSHSHPLDADPKRPLYDPFCAPFIPHCQSSQYSGSLLPAEHSNADFPTTPECQQGTSIFSRSASTVRLDANTSSVQPLSSTNSIIRFFRGTDDKLLPSEPHRAFVAPTNWDQEFDSSLDTTFPDCAESWRNRENNRRRAPARLPLMAPHEDSDIRPKQTMNNSLPHAYHPSTSLSKPLKISWTFDEELTIALLRARMSQSRGESEQLTKYHISKHGLIAAVAGKVLRTAKRCFANRR